MKGSLKHLTATEKKVIENFARLVRAALGDNLIDVEIFGSKVRGDFKKDSDIDILIVVKERTLDVMDKIAEWLVERMNIASEQVFYPYLQE